MGRVSANPEIPVISVVVPCRGQARELERCLRGLAAQNGGCLYETIVVDSACDPAVAAVAAAFSAVRLVRSPAALCAADARNLGAQHAQGRYLAFIDADAVPEPDWLATGVAALKEGAVMVGGSILDALPFHPIAVPDNLLQFIEFSPGRPDGPATHFSGCHLAVERAAFQQAGGFPAGMAVGEDIAFTHAVSERWPDRVRFVRRMRVRHLGRTSLRAYWEHQKTFGYHRGLLGQHLRPIHQQLGAWPFMGVAVAAKRLVYVVVRAAHWYPSALLRLVVLWPSLLYGLAAFARGFRCGCREAVKQRYE